MNIIYMHQYFTTPDMAGGTRSFEFGRRLVEKGHHVEMVTADHQRRFSSRGWTETMEAGIRVHWAPVPYSNKLSFYKRLLAFFRFARAASKKAVELDADVIFATSTPLTIALPGVKTAKKKHAPMVFEVRDLWPQLPITLGILKNPILVAAAKWLEQYAYRNAARIVALCPGFQDAIAAGGYPADRISLIPNSCDFSLFDVGLELGKAFRKKYDWLQDRPLITYCGAIGPANWVEYMVRIASETLALDPDIRFLVVGTGKNEDAVRANATELGVLDKNFFMLPPMSKKDIPSVFSAATIPMVTLADHRGLWDNSSNKFFDALASRKPVAINYGGWEADEIRERDCGLVLDPKDPAAAANTLRNAVHDTEWLTSAGERAAQLGKDKFDRDILADRLEAVLLSACNA